MTPEPFLRDTSDNDPACWLQIAQLRTQLEDSTASAEHMQVLGRLGDLYRMVGAYDEAIPVLENALHLAEECDDARRVVANLIRLATTRQYRGEYVSAMTLFHDALDRAMAPDCQNYADFVWQHMGKCLVEQGRFDAARHCFAMAYALRQTKGNTELLASTECALVAMHDRLRAGSA